MEAEERRKLKDNRSFLIQNIESIDTITDGLFERGVLTRSMWGHIKVQVSKRQKVSTMLHIIPERGPEAFGIFLDMLKETHNDNVYYKLVTDISPRGKFRSQHADVSDIVDDKLPLRSGCYGRLPHEEKYNMKKKYQPRQRQDPLYEHDYDVFLCNSHEDIKWVKILLEKLEMEFHCFLEERDSMPGISHAENGMNAVDRCRKCLFVLSKAFVENPWCIFKVRYAFEKNLENPAKILIPVLIEDCEIPVVLKQYQYIDARNEMEKWLPLLFSAIRSTDLILPLKEKFALANIERDVLRDLLHKGCYKSYDNRIYLAGPCNVGKSTLASVLIGDDIPTEWNSTNGLQIYFGQNCIDLKEKKMIPLKKDSNLKTITGNQFATTPFSAYKKDYDVYVSCDDRGDQEWYCILVDKLESELGIKCLFGPRDFEIGKSLADLIQNAVQRSKTCLLVLSEAYVKDERSKFEVKIAVNVDIENKGNFVIPVLKEDCEIPYLLKQFKYIDKMIDVRDRMETWLPRLYRAISSKGERRGISENQVVAAITEFVKKPNADVDSQDSLSDILIDRQNEREQNFDNTGKAGGTDRDRKNERKQNNDNTNKDGDVDQEWFFKLKFCFEDKYDVHVINSHGIESFYPALEKYIDTKCCKEVPVPGDINKVNNCSVFLFNHRRLNIGNNLSEDQWKQILHSSIQKNQDLLCRYILANRQFLNDDIKVWMSALEYSIRRQNSTCSKAIAWHITKLFVKSLSSLEKVFDIWPGFRCSCSAGVELKMKQHQICSQNVVMVVEVYDEKPNEFPNHFHKYKIQYKISNGYSEEGKSVVLETNRMISDFEPEALPKGIKSSLAETYFQNYSKLSLISPSLVKSRFFKSNQTFVQEPCIQLYCRVKGIIPIGEDHFPTSISSLPTDVLEGHSQLLVKSIRIGSEVGPISGGSGTLGGFVRYLGHDAFITCAHVVLPKECLFKGKERQSIHQQPVQIQYVNQGETGNPVVCGKLINYVFSHGRQNETSVDAAVVMLDDSTVKIDPNDFLLDNGNQRTITDFGLQTVYLNDTSVDSVVDYEDIGTVTQIMSRSAGIVSGIQEKTDRVNREDANIIKFDKLSQILDTLLIQNPKPQDVTEDVHIKEQIRKIDDSISELPPTVTLYKQISFRNISFNQGDSGTCIYVSDLNNTVSGCIGMAIASHPNGGCIVTPLKAILSAFNMI